MQIMYHATESLNNGNFDISNRKHLGGRKPKYSPLVLKEKLASILASILVKKGKTMRDSAKALGISKNTFAAIIMRKII
jgi:hypothetical protein